MTDGAGIYGGRRVLEAMHAAIRYETAVFDLAARSVPRTPARILDFGAGEGSFAKKFRAAGYLVDCIEPDHALQIELRALGGSIFADASEAPDAAYDFTYTINVLEHVGGLDCACSELRRTLMPGGTLFVFVPAFEILWTSLDDEVGHLRRFSRRSLTQTLQRAGFTVTRMEYFDSLGFFAALGARALETIGAFRFNRTTIGFYDRNIFPASRALDGICKNLFGKNLIAVAKS